MLGVLRNNSADIRLLLLLLRRRRHKTEANDCLVVTRYHGLAGVKLIEIIKKANVVTKRIVLIRVHTVADTMDVNKKAQLTQRERATAVHV